MVTGPGWQRGLLLGLLVAGLHLGLLEQGLSLAGEGAADTPPARIVVAFVRELAPAALPAAPAAARPAADAAVARAATAAPAMGAREPATLAPSVPERSADPTRAALPEPASAEPAQPAEPAESAEPAASAPQAEPAPAPDATPGATPVAAPIAEPIAEPMAEPMAVPVEAPASSPLAAATAEAAAADAQAAPPPAVFDWPPSTRLDYRLSGDVRGPVEGQARVEWLRSGARYQVHLDVSVGPSFAPFMSRTASSEGEITAEGLRPARFDERTRIVWRGSRQLQLRMDDDRITLAGGRTVPRPEGLQDTASQFVQLTWLFNTQPWLLRPGQVLTLPLALPRRVLRWRYEVGEPEWLETPAGSMWASPVRPAPDVAGEAGRLGDLVPQAWFAPTLQHLPVRILIRQPAGGHVDLLLEAPPQQAAPGR